MACGSFHVRRNSGGYVVACLSDFIWGDIRNEYRNISCSDSIISRVLAGILLLISITALIKWLDSLKGEDDNDNI